MNIFINSLIGLNLITFLLLIIRVIKNYKNFINILSEYGFSASNLIVLTVTLPIINNQNIWVIYAYIFMIYSASLIIQIEATCYLWNNVSNKPKLIIQSFILSFTVFIGYCAGWKIID